MSNPFDITGRVALVTGASQGIGAVTARVLAELGADVVITARNLPRLEATAQSICASTGRRVLPVQADVAIEADVARLCAAAIAEFGRIDILVNNAGGPLRSPFESTSSADWDSVINVNLRAVFLCSRDIGRQMLAQGKGSIVNISSLAGINAVSFAGAYGAAKAGMQNLTQAMSNSWSSRGVRANAIVVGNIQHADSQRTAETIAAIERLTPIGRLGRAEEIANVVVFLASDASSFVTGTTLVVSGGQIDPQITAA